MGCLFFGEKEAGCMTMLWLMAYLINACKSKSIFIQLVLCKKVLHVSNSHSRTAIFWLRTHFQLAALVREGEHSPLADRMHRLSHIVQIICALLPKSLISLLIKIDGSKESLSQIQYACFVMSYEMHKEQTTFLDLM